MEEKFIYLNEEFDYKYAIRALFGAQTHFRRLGSLMNAVRCLMSICRRSEAAIGFVIC
jgi:hypothetical protein